MILKDGKNAVVIDTMGDQYIVDIKNDSDEYDTNIVFEENTACQCNIVTSTEEGCV